MTSTPQPNFSASRPEGARRPARDADALHDGVAAHEAGTTHGPYGSGNPRLVGVGPNAGNEHRLTAEVTTIGSSPEANLQIPGLAPIHAEVRHADNDEYVLVLHGPAETSAIANAEFDDAEGHILRSGYQVRLGEIELVFERDESSDHGRPHGGREGGEFAHQEQQPDRPVDGPAPLSYEVEQ